MVGWFEESSQLWPGQKFGLRIEEVLYRGKTMFQDVLVFKSTNYGNVLVLDGVIQATERDEFAYQEMITHIPLQVHPHPKKVLVVGGGDGGCVREVLKHEEVAEVHLVEIDESVINLSKKYLPSMAKCFGDPRLTVFIDDGFKFLAKHQNEYDVVISDTSDPEGPAECLFQKDYFELIYDALTPQGVLAMQASENVWLEIDALRNLQQVCMRVFPVVNYAATYVPTYTSGQLGLMICAKSPETNVKVPSRPYTGPELAYYSPSMHSASFVLPTFARKYIQN